MYIVHSKLVLNTLLQKTYNILNSYINNTNECSNALNCIYDKAEKIEQTCIGL